MKITSPNGESPSYSGINRPKGNLIELSIPPGIRINKVGTRRDKDNKFLYSIYFFDPQNSEIAHYCAIEANQINLGRAHYEEQYIPDDEVLVGFYFQRDELNSSHITTTGLILHKPPK